MQGGRFFQVEFNFQDVANAVTERIPKKEYFLPREAATYIGVSNRQVYNFIDDGALPAVNISSQVEPQRKHCRIPRKAIINFLKQRMEI